MSPVKEKRWNIQYPQDDARADLAVTKMAAELGVSPVTAKLLWLRGYQTAEDAIRFLHLEDTAMHDPFEMRDMDAAVRRVEQAIGNRERIAVYGDYDVDGVTSVSLLYLYLTERGADVGYYIPSRSKEGYGLSQTGIDLLRERGVRLIITVDTGITAVQEIAYAKSCGIDVVVTDHHECHTELPDACAVVNPHRPDDAYPFRNLAGVGVAFKLACAMEMAKREREGGDAVEAVSDISNRFADLVAVGTIADVMPVADENRLMIAKGLSRMEKDCRLGFRALIEAANSGKTQSPKLTSSYIGFGIAPRINAAGRVSNATIAVELLLAQTREQADELAAELCRLNSERQTEENRIVEEAYRMMERLPQSERSHMVVLDDNTWHQGVIGIVASRITERYGLPSILITYDGSVGETSSAQDVGKGSGRSVRGINLVEALASCSDLLVRFGGHELAAGLQVRRGDVPELRRRLNAFAAARLREEDLTVRLDADCTVRMRDLSMKLYDEICRMEPFGTANPSPLFVLLRAKLTGIFPMGAGKHVRLTVEQDGISFQAVWFGKSASELPFWIGDAIDILFSFGVNEFRGVCSMQMIVQDARRCDAEEKIFLEQKKRYGEVAGGDLFTEAEEILPDREDLAAVYQYLRRESASGHTSFPLRRMLTDLNGKGPRVFTYGKLKLTFEVLRELHLVDYTEPTEDHYFAELIANPAKTDLETSVILREMRARMRKESTDNREKELS